MMKKEYRISMVFQREKMMILKIKNLNILINIFLLFPINDAWGMQKQAKQTGIFFGSLQSRVNKTWNFLKKEYFLEQSKKENIINENEKKEDAKPYAAIFDIDRTSLDSQGESYKNIKIQINNGTGYFCFYRAVPQILELYKKLIDHKVTIFFITSRCKKSWASNSINNWKNLTSDNLKEVGFAEFKEIYCMSWNRKKKMLQYKSNGEQVQYTAIWKECKRQKIAKKYQIILTADDEKLFLKGENLGFALNVEVYE